MMAFHGCLCINCLYKGIVTLVVVLLLLVVIVTTIVVVVIVKRRQSGYRGEIIYGS